MIFVSIDLQNTSGGFQSFSFLFDTGAGKSELSHKTATALGYSSKDGIRKATITTPAGKIEGYLLKIGSLKVFKKNISDFTFGVFDISNLTTENEDEIDGIIGMDIISQFKFIIDGPKQNIKCL